MKLSTRDAVSYFTNPDPKRTGLLIYGADAMRVALKRQEVIAALLGPNAEEEMRLARMSGTEVRKDPAMLLDAIKSQGFFPGPRVALDTSSTQHRVVVASTRVVAPRLERERRRHARSNGERWRRRP